ncbi:M1 family metallopeptidase [Sediminibacterium ginsengisoli]|uniref:Aminopeptidase N n=1 Tax=Sediminibacterium ginsengisoli TaxID=413434 RepID=A0A1T4KCT1_9BACT|nr:M1 family aminopeptidase [Sediminibacterium ginsengisoli]SJZ40186.1 aminopeptidase N [Sediminibacterium ginsengisoli]
MKKLLFILAFFSFYAGFSQQDTANWQTNYRGAAVKINDLVHTRLDARFDFSRSYLNGKAWITLRPHFYPTDSLRLDAKGMNINKVQLVKASGPAIPLKYTYDSLQLNIRLDRTYKKEEAYTVFIDYTAKPDEFTVHGSNAISDAKGLYFINPRGEDKDKPMQVWTQGETESTSMWIPTIDKPNQKTTQEFSLTVPAKFVTLSNGLLTAQIRNADGTRTDKWVMTLPHSPYLFFIGMGEYAIVKDRYKGKEVSYYVEKEYEKVARQIFGLTPEMIAFFADKLGVEFPWPKYSQIVGRDYVSGAMENTTATLHQESAQQDARELLDGNEWESTIAHELFHQWFGDLVTAESWSNLTVNESFANYSQLLWFEHKYGKDEAGYENANEMAQYMSRLATEGKKDLVRFYYRDKEDMFDLVSYQKGGRILNMLRNYLGDSAFFKSLNLYLSTYKFGSGNAHKLRLAFEQVSGKDLNWFFNQWYFGSGQPSLEFSHSYNAQNQTLTLTVKQTQPDKLFKLPITVDVYTGNSKKRHELWVENDVDSFAFKVSSKPDLVNFDADHVLLAEIKEDKTLADYIFQFKHAGLYLDRSNAIDFAAAHIEERGAMELLLSALNDPFYRIRSKALNSLHAAQPDAAALKKIEQLAKTDPKRTVRADAIDLLGTQKNPVYKDFFLKAVNDSSYSVAAAALQSLALIDCPAAFSIASKMAEEPSKGRLPAAISDVLIACGDESVFDIVAAKFEAMPASSEKFSFMGSFASFMMEVKDPVKFKKGIDLIVAFRDAIPSSNKAETDPFINNLVLSSIAGKKEAAGAKELADYVRRKISSKP